MANAMSVDVKYNKSIVDWFSGESRRWELGWNTKSLPSEFTQRCITTLERIGDEASNAEKRAEAVAAYSAALSLSHSTPDAVLIKWARMMLNGGSAREVLSAATKVCSC